MVWLPRVVFTPNAPQLYYLFLLTFNILLGLLYFIDRVKISDLKFEVIMDTNCATKLSRDLRFLSFWKIQVVVRFFDALGFQIESNVVVLYQSFAQ